MKKIIETTEAEGLEKLLGEKVLLMCMNYFYTGTLIGVNDTTVLLKDPAIVYETGEWTESKFKDAQKLHTDEWYVSIATIESFGVAK